MFEYTQAVLNPGRKSFLPKLGRAKENHEDRVLQPCLPDAWKTSGARPFCPRWPPCHHRESPEDTPTLLSTPHWDSTRESRPWEGVPPLFPELSGMLLL